MSDEMGRIPTGSGDDDAKWMARFTELPDAGVDALLQGVVPDGADVLAPVAELAAELRQRAGIEPVPPMSGALRAQISGGNVVPLDRARLVRRPLISAAATAAVVLAALVAGASQQVLPDPVQRVVASVAERLGINMPHPDDDIDAEPAGSRSTPPDTTPGGASPADPGAPGDGATPATPAEGTGRDGEGNPGQGGGPDGGQEGNPGQGGGQDSNPGVGGGAGGGQEGNPGQGGDQGGGPGPPPDTPGNHASEQGQQSGTGTGGPGSPGSPESGQGQQQGIGTGKGSPQG